MKKFLPVILILLTGFSNAQQYALIDKKMASPVIYTNSVKQQDNFNGYFAIEKDKLNAVISEIEKISKMLTGKNQKESFNYKIGNTTFTGLRIALAAEDRLDVVLITDCGDVKTILHLCDAKISNANNAFYITTLLKYIRSYESK